MILSDNETKVDLLNNEAIAKTIVSLIKDSKEQPISIGIHGDWGAGKSSILEMVENEVKLASSVSGKKYSCIRFNGWKHQGFEDSKVALMVFVKGTNFTTAIESIHKNVVTHEYFVRKNKIRNETSSNYIFRLPQDANKEVFLEIIAFNFDKMID